MLTIRLQRTGKKNQADFRIVLAEKESPVKKKIVEVLGSYNPRKKDFRVREERLKYWLGQRIELSETVHNLFVTNKLVEGGKVKAFTIPKKPVEKAAEGAAPAAAVPAPETAAETPAPAVEPKPEAPVEKPSEAPKVEAKENEPVSEATIES
jgi:small subunit ribosomal protein S16